MAAPAIGALPRCPFLAVRAAILAKLLVEEGVVGPPIRPRSEFFIAIKHATRVAVHRHRHGGVGQHRRA